MSNATQSINTKYTECWINAHILLLQFIPLGYAYDILAIECSWYVKQEYMLNEYYFLFFIAKQDTTCTFMGYSDLTHIKNFMPYVKKLMLLFCCCGHRMVCLPMDIGSPFHCK
jgi:hypothetical protein